MSRVGSKVVVLLALCALALATLGCGGGRGMMPAMPASVRFSAWLLRRGAGTPARAVFLAAASRGASENSSYSVDDRRPWIPRIYGASEKEWAYWSDAALSPDIMKVQARPAPGKYESPGNDFRAGYGILDYAIFWIGHDVQPDGGYFGVRHEFLVGSGFHAPVDGRRPDFLVPNIAWRGDSLGMAKASGSSVWGASGSDHDVNREKLLRQPHVQPAS